MRHTVWVVVLAAARLFLSVGHSTAVGPNDGVYQVRQSHPTFGNHVALAEAHVRFAARRGWGRLADGPGAGRLAQAEYDSALCASGARHPAAAVEKIAPAPTVVPESDGTST